MAFHLVPYDKWMFNLNSLVEKLNDQETSNQSWVPLVDVTESSDSFTVYADLPGVEPKNIEITMDNNALILKGSRTFNIEDKKSYYRSERWSGAFYRRFDLPDGIDSENISAKSRQGVLELTIPKKINSTKKITIEVNE